MRLIHCFIQCLEQFLRRRQLKQSPPLSFLSRACAAISRPRPISGCSFALHCTLAFVKFTSLALKAHGLIRAAQRDLTRTDALVLGAVFATEALAM